MIERFRQLAPREQLILGVGAALAVLIIAWSFVWTPLASAVDELRESVREQSRLMVDFKRATGLPSTTSRSAAGGAADLNQLVDQTARPMGLATAFTRTAFEADGSVFRVTFQNASFALLVDWLVALDREHGVQAGTVQLTPGSHGPGFVSGWVVLGRS